MEGLGKIEIAVAGSEVEGLCGLLRGAISHYPMSYAQPPSRKCYHTPTATISKPLPQEARGSCIHEASTPAAREAKLALEVPSSAASQVLEVAIPGHMTPLCLQLGGVKRVYKC